MFAGMEKEESRLRLEDKLDARMEALDIEREQATMDVQKSKREGMERAKALHDKVKAGKAASARKKKAHSEHYRKEARRQDLGTSSGERPAKAASGKK